MAVLSARGRAPNFALAFLRENLVGENTQKLLFVAFGLAFLIKMPAFPFHGWMPDAYRNMPLPVLAVFSAWCRRWPPTASCGSCCRCSRRRPTTGS